LPELDLEDQTYELGSGRLVQGADEQLAGTKVGDIVALALDPSATPGEAEGAGRSDPPLDLKVLVKRVRQKILPEPDDAFAADASEFETIAELRAELESRIEASKQVQAVVALREKSLEALSQLVDVDLPDVLVEHERDHLAASLVSRLEQQRVRLADYLAATGQNEQSLLAGLEEQARLQVRVDLALRALAAAESLEVDESDVDEEIVRLAQRSRRTPAEIRSDLERDGRIGGLRSELRNAKALAWLTEHVGVVDEEGNPIDRSALRLGETADGAVDDESADDDDAEDVDDASELSQDHGDAGPPAGGVGSDPDEA
jgi:trigger factor